MITIPAFADARRDHALRGSPMTVYLALIDRLHPLEWQEVPQLSLCSELDLAKRTVIRALNTLVLRGYIEREGRVVANSHAQRWRLVYDRSTQSE